MLNLPKILFPVDFSDRCAEAAHSVKSVAKLFHSEITLLHVLLPAQDWIGSPEVNAGIITDFWENRRTAARKQLESFLAEELSGFTAHRVMVEGDPAREIVRYAHDHEMSLIAMPTHGYGGFRRFLLGSVTAKVLHDAEIPVLTGAHLEEIPDLRAVTFESVLCAIDLRDHSRPTLDWAAKLAKTFQARLHVAHAMPTATTPTGLYTDPDFEVKLKQLAREGIDKLLGEIGAQAEIHIQAGDPARVVRSVAEQTGADLVVIGRASGGLLGRLRAHAYAILREAPCPVVSV
jgi:nucleotide-binding universal stress UspA family protein